MIAKTRRSRNDEKTIGQVRIKDCLSRSGEGNLGCEASLDSHSSNTIVSEEEECGKEHHEEGMCSKCGSVHEVGVEERRADIFMRDSICIS